MSQLMECKLLLAECERENMDARKQMETMTDNGIPVKPQAVRELVKNEGRAKGFRRLLVDVFGD